MSAPLPHNEKLRLQALRQHAILDTPSEPLLDCLTRLAAKLFSVPIALISLMDKDRQWFMSSVGLDIHETPRDLAFCAYTILGKEPLVVPDTFEDECFRSHPLVIGAPHIRFYAGAPLVTPDGYSLGTLCVIDIAPRPALDESEQTLLTGLAALVSAQLDVRLANLQWRQAQAALQESEERYALAARGANDGLWDWNCRTNLVYLSPRWRAMLGEEEEEEQATPKAWLERVHPEDRQRVRAKLEEHRLGHTSEFCSEHRASHRDGTWRWVLSRGLAVRGPGGEALRMAGSQTDITENKTSDALTGLPNRVLFTERLTRAVERAQKDPSFLFAVLFLDLDNFKVVNDSLGHLAGDQLLLSVAERLTSSMQGMEGLSTHPCNRTVARLGGDEFAVLLEGLPTKDTATMMAEHYQAALREPVLVEGREVFPSASIGVTINTTSYQTASDVLRDADTAMYRAKAGGRARYKLFDSAMRAYALARLEMETDLRRALDRNELVVYYQPKMHLGTQQVAGMEALVRWQHPKYGLLSPDSFIPIAEETGLILPLGYWVLTEACKQMQRWNQNLTAEKPLIISVNLSSRQFLQTDLVAQVEQVLVSTQLPPRHLRLEVTESLLMEDPHYAAAALQQLKRIGVGLEVDDFGTGYSSLSYLHRFPFDALKIDRSFVMNIGKVNESNEIVRTIIFLARNLGMSVVAEGIETFEQFAYLASLGCDYGQGYYFSQPLPADQIEDFLQTWGMQTPHHPEVGTSDIAALAKQITVGLAAKQLPSPELSSDN